MEARISLITLGVADLDRSKRFYAQWLEAAPVLDTGEVAFFQLAGLVLGLWPWTALSADARLPKDRPAAGGIVLAHNVRRRDEVEPVLAAAVKAGAALLRPAESRPWGGYTGYFADPDGHLWEVAWNPAWPIDAEGRVRFAT